VVLLGKFSTNKNRMINPNFNPILKFAKVGQRCSIKSSIKA